nr:ABC transporter ATP-binding protein [Desulfobulbaceae bacterium]
MHLLTSQSKLPRNRLPLFSLDNLSFSYPDGKPALDGVTLKIYHGDRIALLGQNGSGKTTLAKHLNGIHMPSGGKISYKGNNLKHQIDAIRLEVGVLFQDPDDHLFCSTLYEDIAFGPMNQGLPENLVDQRVRAAAKAAELEAYLFKPAHLLSYGQKKRAAFAAVMAMEPAILILDEPTANLDPKHEQIFKDQLSRYQGTLICINHDLIFLYGLCDRAVVMSVGKIHHDYAFNDLLTHKASLREHGLDFSFRFQCCGGHAGHRHDHGGNQALPQGAGSESTANAVIELTDYSYRYPDGTSGLDGVNITVSEGDKVALIGENGAGKSTLACVLLGTISGVGSYSYQGVPVTPRGRKGLWGNIGMVFQDSADQLFCSSCWDEIAFGPRQLGCSVDEIDSRVTAALEMVKLVGYDKRVPLNMSGGERKRLAIAAVLSMNPQVLILDEPTAGLDPHGEEILLEILKRLPVTLLLVTHDLFFLRELTARTVVMHQGKVIRNYSTTEFLADSHLESLNQLDFTYKNHCSHEIMAMQSTNFGA